MNLDCKFAAALDQFLNNPDISYALANGWVIVLDLPFSLVFDLECTIALYIDRDIDYAVYHNFDIILSLADALELNSQLIQGLQQLKNQKPDPFGNWEIFAEWWEVSSLSWVDQLRSLLTKHCNITQNTQLNYKQMEVLKNYYNANKFLADCLKNTSDQVRSQIEDTLLLPIAEIEKRQLGN